MSKVTALSDHPRRDALEIHELGIEFGHGAQRIQAVTEVSCTVPAGQFVCILGPSGCGKSTLLETVAGHRAPSSGRVSIGNQTIAGPHPERGLVFQHHTLFPWKSVTDNVAFGLKMRGVARAERRRQARELLQLVGLVGFEDHYPTQLSGGMQQRVEIARVLINRPNVLLMDEPFGALDAQTRLTMQELLLDVWATFRATVLFVTHDVDEALFLADRVLVMTQRPGRILEDFAVDFERPRTSTLVTASEFVKLKRHCLSLIRDESRRTPAGSPVTHATHRDGNQLASVESL